MKTIILTHAAAKDLDALREDAREFVMSGLMRYAISGDGDVKRLSGNGGLRLRIGDIASFSPKTLQPFSRSTFGKRETTTYLRH
jgi:mRNA interferase RelE/StbE